MTTAHPILEMGSEVSLLSCRTGTISPGDYLLAIGDVWLDNHSLEEAAHVLTAADKVVKLRIQKNECYAGNIHILHHALEKQKHVDLKK